MMWRWVVALGLLAGWVARACSGEQELSGEEIAKRAAQASEQPQTLGDLGGRLSVRNVRRVLASLVKQTAESNVASPELVSAFARVLPKVAVSPAEVLEVIGPHANKTAVRQVFYRRYREQWIFEHPLHVCVVFDCVRGMEARVIAVFPTAEPTR